MHARVRWTPALDDQLRTLRGSGITWDHIARTMAMGRNTVLERGRRIGARRVCSRAVPPPAEALDRPPRPPGHPATWGLITQGTLLQDEPYPFPVFL